MCVCVCLRRDGRFVVVHWEGAPQAHECGWEGSVSAGLLVVSVCVSLCVDAFQSDPQSPPLPFTQNHHPPTPTNSDMWSSGGAWHASVPTWLLPLFWATQQLYYYLWYLDRMPIVRDERERGRKGTHLYWMIYFVCVYRFTLLGVCGCVCLSITAPPPPPSHSPTNTNEPNPKPQTPQTQIPPPHQKHQYLPSPPPPPTPPPTNILQNTRTNPQPPTQTPHTAPPPRSPLRGRVRCSVHGPGGVHPRQRVGHALPMLLPCPLPRGGHGAGVFL
jgi:hypothetical protein